MNAVLNSLAAGDVASKLDDGVSAAWKLVPLKVERVQPIGRVTQRVGSIALEFGLPLQDRRVSIGGDETVLVGPGRIVLLLGPSGSGKTSVLNRIASHFATARIIRERETLAKPHSTFLWNRMERRGIAQAEACGSEAAVIDTVAPWASVGDAIAMLTACGLGDANLWIRPVDTLSDGERFRACLTRAAALNERDGGAAPLLCDEFASMLHRRSAKAISFNLRKLASRCKLSIVLASSHDDIVADLNPDAIVRFLGSGRCVVQERSETQGTSLPGPSSARCRCHTRKLEQGESMRFPRWRRAISFRRGLRIERGSKSDYDAFAAMHYRTTDELGYVDKVFVMRERRGGEPLGIVVYAHGPLELSLRNLATDGRFVRDAAAVNARFRILRRLVIHPDVRGCGLGHYLVRRTLPLVGTEYVECLAAMGEYNPVFEKAGMRRIGQYDLSPRQRAALHTLRAMNVDPSAADFVAKVCRSRSVREVVARAVSDWYATTTAGGARRVERQSPEFLAQTFRGLIASRPVYYIWKLETRNKKLERGRLKRGCDAKTNPYDRPTQRLRGRPRNDSTSHATVTRKRHAPF